MFRWLVNFGLIALPIAVTIGILLGIETERVAVGKPPLFRPSNKVVKSEYCQKSYGVHPLSKGQEYTLNPNQWGWDGKEGGLCMNVTTFSNRTYASNTSAPEWSVTWQYPQGPQDQPVHAYPNIMVEGVLPLMLKQIGEINLDFEWTYGLGSKATKQTNKAALVKDEVNANVAMDTFLHKEKAKSTSSENASHEIMVWFAAIGPATQPIGMSEGALTTKTIGGATFELFYGKNGGGQYVLTWYSKTVVDQFKGDLMPLITAILDLEAKAGQNLPSATDYLGYMALGSEAYSAPDNVTFHVPTLSIDISKK